MAGLVTLTIGLGAVVLALVEGEQWGFDSAKTLALLAAGVLSLAAFWVVEHRVAQPIVEFPLFRNRPYLGASAAAFALVGSYWTVIFFQPQYLQNVLDYSVLMSGVLVLPITLPMAALSAFSGPLIERLGARVLMTAGMICAVAALVLQARVSSSSDYLSVLPGYLLFGIALGLVYAPMSTAAMMAMPRAKAGIAAGVLAMNRVFAGAVGLAVVGAVFHNLQSEELQKLLADRSAGVGPRASRRARWPAGGIGVRAPRARGPFLRSGRQGGGGGARHVHVRARERAVGAGRGDRRGGDPHLGVDPAASRGGRAIVGGDTGRYVAPAPPPASLPVPSLDPPPVFSWRNAASARRVSRGRPCAGSAQQPVPGTVSCPLRG